MVVVSHPPRSDLPFRQIKTTQEDPPPWPLLYVHGPDLLATDGREGLVPTHVAFY
jgi:hypothetical protein